MMARRRFGRRAGGASLPVQQSGGIEPDGYLTELVLGGRTLTIADTTGGPVPFQRDATDTYMFIGAFDVLEDSLDGTPGLHGATLNPVFQGKHGWDEWLFTAGGPTGDANLYDPDERVTFPVRITPGDCIVFFERTGPDFAASGTGARDPAGDWYPVHCIPAALSSPDMRFAPETLRGSNPYRSRGVSDIVDLEAKLASLISLPIPAGKIALATMVTKMSRHFPASAFTRVDTNPGGYEPSVPVGFLLNAATMSGYSRDIGWTWNAASQHILDAGNPLADRKTLLAWMIRHGMDYFFPQLNDIYEVANNGGGHFSAHSIPAMWALWALGETALLSDYGTPDQYLRDNVEQFAYMTPALLATMNEHTSALEPHSFRRREVLSVSGSDIAVAWERTNGDPSWCVLHGLILRKSGDPTTSYGIVNEPTNQQGASSPLRVTLTITGLGAVSPGDFVWFDTQWPLAEGSPAWSITGFLPTDYPAAGPFPATDALSGYTASPKAFYADSQNASYEMNAILAVLFGVDDSPIWGPIVDYVIYANRANFPGARASSYDFYDWKFGENGAGAEALWTVDGVGGISMKGFYDAHMEDLVGSTRFNATIGYS